MTECCEWMREALNRKLVLPRYYSPNDDSCEFEGYQLWTQNILAGTKRRGGMLMNYCPGCGQRIELHREVPKWVKEEAG